MALPLEDYALLSDCHSAALVGKNGSVDWLAFPRFDSASCFTALLGKPEHGSWTIAPVKEYKVSRKYIEGTLVLETRFENAEGSCRLIDCMPYGDTLPTFIRSLEGITGEMEMFIDFRPRFDYGKISPWVRTDEEGRTIAIGGPDALVLTSDVRMGREDEICYGKFKIRSGEKKNFVLCWFPSHMQVPNTPEPGQLIRKTIEFWRDWRNSCQYQGFDEEPLKNSLMVLKALTYKPTGAIIAAPTTSLPEEIGGTRNWDYRFSWLRDSSFALMALLRAGYRDEAREWNDWLLRAVAGSPSDTNIMYGIRGERRLPEFELDWLPGYENSNPVRIGNAAHEQFQLDVFGEMLSTAYIGRRHNISMGDRAWLIEKNMVKYVCQHWQDPDDGIWEVRSGQKHFTHSKIMAWQAVDCAVKIAKEFHLDGNLHHWEHLREKIHRDICEKGFNTKLNSFTQTYDSDELDSSLLMMTRIGFLPPTDPRVIGTVKAIQENLMDGGLVRRYRPQSGVDGVNEDEGCFIPCTFWLVDNLRLLGRKDEALELYRYLETLKNDVGLYAEEYSVKQKRLVGNFPQGFSHIAHAVSTMGFCDMIKTNLNEKAA